MELRTATAKEIEETYNNPYIINAVSEDNRPFFPIVSEFVEYKAAYHDNVFMGLFLILDYNIYEKELHSLLLKNSIKFSRQFGEMIIDYIFEDPTVLRVTALIADDLPKTINTAKKAGFVQEGIKKNATIKKGKVLDIHILGARR